MSRGPGRIEREIEAAMDAAPDNALTIEDLFACIYPEAAEIEKKHRVAISRATWNVLQRRDDLGLMRAESQGRRTILFHLGSIASYGMAEMKSSWPYVPESKLRAMMKKENYQAHMREGGMWWKQLRFWQAERAGDVAYLEQAEAEAMREARALMASAGIR